MVRLSPKEALQFQFLLNSGFIRHASGDNNKNDILLQTMADNVKGDEDITSESSNYSSYYEAPPKKIKGKKKKGRNRTYIP